MNMKKIILAGLMMGAMFVSCENADKEFDDFEYQTISFAQQTPIRTIVLGDDVFDTTMDNEHRFQIISTLAGVWKNKHTRTVNYKVDNTLCEGASFDNGNPILPMPANYYTLSTDKMQIPAGEIFGRVDVQLTDAFFNDPKATALNYVIPVVLTSASDSILQGKPKDGITHPNRLNGGDWNVQPKDYTLMAVKYKNKFAGAWLSYGTDEYTVNGVKNTVNRQFEYIEKADVRTMSTVSLTQSRYPISTTVDAKDATGGAIKLTLTVDLLISVNDNGDCSITTDTPGAVASGNGTWTYQGAKKAWGDKDRDEFVLNYNITFPQYVLDATTGETGTVQLSSKDTLVAQSRQSKFETFSVVLE